MKPVHKNTYNKGNQKQLRILSVANCCLGEPGPDLTCAILAFTITANNH